MGTRADLADGVIGIAHERLGKPAYLGEFNVRVYTEGNGVEDPDEGHTLETRNRYLEEWYRTADEVDCNAVLPWQVVLDDTRDHDGFQLYRDESGDVVEDYAEVVAGKRGK